MMRRQKDTSQPVRLFYLILYLAFLFLMNRLAFGQWLPLTTSKGLWFYSGAAALILGSLLTTPFFTSPANAISYLVAALIALFAFDVPTAASFDKIFRQCVIVFCLIMLAVCVLNILFKDSKNRLLHNLAEAGRVLADNLGRPGFVFSVIIIYALWEYHREAPKELFFIGLAALVIVSQQPLETLGDVVQRVLDSWHPNTAPKVIGSMVAHQSPGLLLIRQDRIETIKPGTCLLAAEKHPSFQVGVNIGYFGRDEGVLLRALEINVPDRHNTKLRELTKFIPEGHVSILDQTVIEDFRNDVDLLKNLDSFVGIVAPETSIARLYFEIVHDKDIEQGRLVETYVGEKHVLYQVLDGLTKEEIIEKKNTHGFARGEAVQIGVWDEHDRKFKLCDWIPNLNAPVFLKSIEKPSDNIDAVGHLPSTNYEIGVKNLDELVTHNTAILGIMGIGKSMLSIELIERLITARIKVICIDLTRQYATELSDFHDSTHEAECLKKIQEAGEKDKGAIAENSETGGSVSHLREAIYNDLKLFLDKDDPHFLKILNPYDISATKQGQEPKSYNLDNVWHVSGGLRQITPTEITQIISEAALQIAQASGMMRNPVEGDH